MTEADKPRPLGEHLARAADIHAKLCDFVKESKKQGLTNTKENLDRLRESAAKGFWLYPVVEARLGIPR